MELLIEKSTEKEYKLAENSRELLEFYDEVDSSETLDYFLEDDSSHLEDIEDGAGCVLTWEYLSEERN